MGCRNVSPYLWMSIMTMNNDLCTNNEKCEYFEQRLNGLCKHQFVWGGMYRDSWKCDATAWTISVYSDERNQNEKNNGRTNAVPFLLLKRNQNAKIRKIKASFQVIPKDRQRKRNANTIKLNLNIFIIKFSL